MGKVVLCVDDSASIRQMVAFTLKTAGYEVIEAANGKEGLAKVGARPPDLVLTDQNMPIMDGLTMIRAMRAIPLKCPILMLTTEAGADMKSKGREAGATGWLIKPFDPNALIAVVRKVVPG